VKDGSAVPVVDESVQVAAPAEAVWRALVAPEERADWWPGLDLDPVVGGRFEEHWRDAAGTRRLTTGTVTALVAPRLLAFTWADPDWPGPTRGEWRLSQTGSGTSVRVRHVGWELLPDGGRLAREHRQGWRLHLDDLRAHLERGHEA
jgi:uncharacterized protein YndB with AHSA1/START domain